MEPCKIVAASFDFINRLGAGHFGEVWLVRDTGLNTEYALKCIPPDKVINQQNFFQEAQILKLAEHSNIVGVRETGTLDDGRIYVAMEYLKKGSLEDEAKGGYVLLTRAKRLMIDVLRGLEYAHSKGVVHRDIKPANILVADNGDAKLSDFGLALPDYSTLDLSSIKGYQYISHLAPEVKTFKDYSFLCDIYSAGITLYRLVNGDSYLPSVSTADVRQLAISGKFPDRNHYRDFIPRPLKILINKAINIDPTQRYQSAAAMRHALEQVDLKVNWNEKKLNNGMQWIASSELSCYQITKVFEKGKWSIVTCKGKSKSELRRVSKLCMTNMSAIKADQAARRILQDFVLGKHT